MRFLVLLAALVLAGCGADNNLKLASGSAAPVAAYGAKVAKTPKQLTAPSTQARPQRSDELLTSSEERRSDEFDLPPK